MHDFHQKIITIFHLNTRCVRNKLEYLSEYLSDNQIVCFSETHSDKTIDCELLKWSDFQGPVRKDRNSFGGGVMLYIRKTLAFKRMQELENVY